MLKSSSRGANGRVISMNFSSKEELDDGPLRLPALDLRLFFLLKCIVLVNAV